MTTQCKTVPTLLQQVITHRIKTVCCTPEQTKKKTSRIFWLSCQKLCCKKHCFLSDICTNRKCVSWRQSLVCPMLRAKTARDFAFWALFLCTTCLPRSCIRSPAWC